MKIRLLGNSMRLRLSQSEVKTLRNNGKVMETIKFGIITSQQLNYILQKAAIPEISVAYKGNIISILIPTDLADHWADTALVGLEKEIPLAEEELLKVLIEKDFQCLSEREGEDESDLFPNPEEGKEC